ncbi:zinc-ribbon domain-containing protein [Thalassovita aquimarina]|uniref:Zinc-ribbon domain-containing protein n=1 Tax=Thalassovita aquimarina TaxID=2785917 RepID=A0ABS5HPP7_9RHOB|nr:zinc-ribbon domain-containing protein [Thalassovita aquimarina]MBR9650931.1 zinc-ribbon domain-containing protein [Thalassovita aquimarina]
MRLICPNCGAQYEVPDSVIPETGRDVQCSNCGHTWFQHHPDDAAAAPDDLELPETDLAGTDAQGMPPEPDHEHETAPEPEPAAEAPQRRQLDPSIAEVLREEAEREARAREAERGAGLESQPDLGLAEPEDESSRRARQARERMARMKGEPEVAAPETQAEPGDEAASRRDLLPDIDEINSSLRAASDRRPAEADDYDTPVGTPELIAKKGSGFRNGFLLALLIAAAFWALYVYADPIAAKVPALKPVLGSYVAVIDQARGALDAQVKALLIKLDAMGAEATT